MERRVVPPLGATSTKPSPLWREGEPERPQRLAPLSMASIPMNDGDTDAVGAQKLRHCVDVLVQGYVESFTQLFTLTHHVPVYNNGVVADDDDDEGPGDLTPMREISLESFDFLQELFVRAEVGERQLNIKQVHTAHRTLAEYFEKCQDYASSIKYYLKCLDDVASEAIQEEEEEEEEERNAQMKLQESSIHEALGRLYEKIGDIQRCVRHREQHLACTKQMSSEESKLGALKAVVMAYLAHADKCERNGETQQAITYLERCLEASRAAEDLEAEGVTNHRLGWAYYKLQNYRRSVYFFQACLDICKRTNDAIGEGKAAYALAKTHENMGEMRASFSRLREFEALAEATGAADARLEAYYSLGTAYAKACNFNKAVAYFEKYFDVAQSVGDVGIIDRGRVALGIARGNAILKRISTTSPTENKIPIADLIDQSRKTSRTPRSTATPRDLTHRSMISEDPTPRLLSVTGLPETDPMTFTEK